MRMSLKTLASWKLSLLLGSFPLGGVAVAISQPIMHFWLSSTCPAQCWIYAVSGFNLFFWHDSDKKVYFNVLSVMQLPDYFACIRLTKPKYCDLWQSTCNSTPCILSLTMCRLHYPQRGITIARKVSSVLIFAGCKIAFCFFLHPLLGKIGLVSRFAMN